MSMSQDAQDVRSSGAAGAAGNSGMSSPGTMIVGPPRYPPSSVKRWLTCPEFWRLSKVWEPRAAGWTPHIVVGRAIHAGIAAWLRPRIVDHESQENQIEGVSHAVPFTSPVNLDPLTVALEVLTNGYVQQDTWALEGLQALVTKGLARLRRLVEGDILPGAEVIAVEYPDPVQDPRLGTHRLHRVVDCILARGDALEVWDWKTKIRLDEAYLGETARAVLHSWQLLDYSWHVEQWAHDGRFTVGQALLAFLVRHAAHGLVILGPKLMAQAIPVTLTPERLNQWRRDATNIWGQMWEMDPRNSRATCLPWHNWEACSDRHLHYGKECQFVPACHLLNGNEEQFSGVYQKVGDGLHDSD